MSDMETLWNAVSRRLSERSEGCVEDVNAQEALRRIREHVATLEAAARVASVVGPEQRAAAEARGYARAREQAARVADVAIGGGGGTALGARIRAMQDGAGGA